MVALADTALDLCVLKLSLLLRLVALVFRAGLPVADGAEGDVFCDGDGVCLWSRGLALFLTEFRPGFALGYAGVYDLLHDCLLDAAGCLVLFAVFADPVRYYRLRTVFVLDRLGRRQGEIVLVIFFRPVGAAGTLSVYKRLAG